MSPYLALIRLAFQRHLAYRFANVSAMVTNLFFGWLRASILVALFAGQAQVAGYTVRDAVTYTGLTQALLSLIAIFGWWDLVRSIRGGEVAADLSRPLDFFWYWCAQDIGRAMAQLLTRGAPLLAAYALFYPVSLPPDVWHGLALIPAVALALLVSFAWRFLVSLAAFWTPDAVGIGRAAWAFSMLLSGFMMPLNFFPEPAQAVLQRLPFAGMIDTVVRIYLGQLNGWGLLGALAAQAAWFAALYALAQVGLGVSVRRLVVQGG